jgi:hypothetical protein
MIQLLLILLLSMPAFADTETTADVTEKDAGATHKCVRTNGKCTYDPRTNIWSDGGTNDDIIYWDQHGNLNDGHRDTSFSIMNDIDTFLTEEQMLAGFTLDSSIGLRDRNYVGDDPFTVQIKVTDGTTTYSDTQSFTTNSGQDYQTISSQLIIPENTLAYSLATFGLILDGASLTNGYNGPQTNSIGLTATYELQDSVAIVTDIINNTIDDILTDTGISAVDSAQMDIDVATPNGTQNISIGVTTSPTSITLSVPTVSGTIEKITINTGMASSDSQPEQVAEVAEAVSEVESAVEEQESESDEKEEKQDSKETKTEKAKAVQAIVNRVLQAVEMAGGDDTVKLALMGVLGNSEFKSYQRSEIPDVAFYDSTVIYDNSQMNDLYGDVFSLGSDQSMDALVNSQY